MPEQPDSPFHRRWDSGTTYSATEELSFDAGGFPEIGNGDHDLTLLGPLNCPSPSARNRVRVREESTGKHAGEQHDRDDEKAIEERHGWLDSSTNPSHRYNRAPETCDTSLFNAPLTALNGPHAEIVSSQYPFSFR